MTNPELPQDPTVDYGHKKSTVEKKSKPTQTNETYVS